MNTKRLRDVKAGDVIEQRRFDDALTTVTVEKVEHGEDGITTLTDADGLQWSARSMDLVVIADPSRFFGPAT
jgi:hypothetical protein